MARPRPAHPLPRRSMKHADEIVKLFWPAANRLDPTTVSHLIKYAEYEGFAKTTMGLHAVTGDGLLAASAHAMLSNGRTPHIAWPWVDTRGRVRGGW